MLTATKRSALFAVALVPMMAATVLAQVAEPDEPSGDPTSEAAEQRPWYAGVGEQAKASAQKLLDAGNKSFLEKDYREALRHYVDATTHWDHPAIHFNVVRALIKLDRTIEAYDALERALKYGAAPFSEAIYAEALNYQQLLRSQIATLEVRCGQSGAVVTLDGSALLQCPGSKTIRVRPGPHQLVGELAGHLTKRQEVVAIAQKTESVELTLVGIADATVLERRWPTWKPWAVVGGGATIALVGGLLRWRGSSSMDDYHRLVAAECPEPLGCESGDLRTELDDKRDSAQRWGHVGIATLSVGGAVLATGAVLLFLNRERPVLDESAASQPTVTASVGSGQAAIGISLGF